MVLLVLAGAVFAYVAYDRATAPNRSAPDVVVDNYLRAFLVDHNDTKASLFTCEDEPSGLGELRALRDDLRSREQRFDTNFMVKWGRLQVRGQDRTAEVDVDLTISAYVAGTSQGDRQSWRFTTRLGEDWRVCGGTRVG